MWNVLVSRDKYKSQGWSEYTTSCVFSSCRFDDTFTRADCQQEQRSLKGDHRVPWWTPVFGYSSFTSCLVSGSYDLSSQHRLPSIPNHREFERLDPSIPFGWWGDLAAVAADDAKTLNINTSVFLYQLKDLVGSIRDFRNALKRPSPKTWSKAYLAWQYGVASTARDAREALHALQKTLPSGRRYSIVRSRGSLSTVVLRPGFNFMSDIFAYKIFYKSDIYHEFEKTLRDWDLYLSSKNVWDLIPYSFVADWFLNLQQFTEFHDRQQYYETVDVLGVTKSRRTEFQFSLTNSYWIATSDARYVGYKRMTQRRVDETFLLFKSPQTFHNWAEGLSLILSKSRV
jgi:hypothetical protein